MLPGYANGRGLDALAVLQFHGPESCRLNGLISTALMGRGWHLEVRSGYCTGNSMILSLLSMESCNSGVCTGVATCPYSRYNYLFNMLVMHVKRVTVSIDFEFMSLGWESVIKNPSCQISLSNNSNRFRFWSWLAIQVRIWRWRGLIPCIWFIKASFSYRFRTMMFKF